MEDELFNSIPKIILKNDVLKIRTITDNDGTTLFSLSDICKLLGVCNSTSNKEKLNKDDRYKTTESGKKIYVGVNNVIRLIFQAKNDFYNELTDWLSDKVIPLLFEAGRIEIVTNDKVEEENEIIESEDDYLDDKSYRMLNKELKSQNLIFGKEIIRVSQVLMEIQNIIDTAHEDMTKVHKELQSGGI